MKKCEARTWTTFPFVFVFFVAFSCYPSSDPLCSSLLVILHVFEMIIATKTQQQHQPHRRLVHISISHLIVASRCNEEHEKRRRARHRTLIELIFTSSCRHQMSAHYLRLSEVENYLKSSEKWKKWQLSSEYFFSLICSVKILWSSSPSTNFFFCGVKSDLCLVLFLLLTSIAKFF